MKSLLKRVSLALGLAASFLPSAHAESARFEQTWNSALSSKGTLLSDQEIVFDAETLRFYLEPAREFLGPAAFDELSENLQGATLRRTTGVNAGIEITINLKKSVLLKLKDPDTTEVGGIYGITIPKRLETFVSIDDETVKLRSSFWPFQRLMFLVNIPAIPDTVWLKSVDVNLSDSSARVVATILGSTVAVVAEVKMAEGQPNGRIDLLQTVLLNLILSPNLIFGPLK